MNLELGIMNLCLRVKGEVFNNISKGAEIVIEYTAQNILDSTLIHNSKFLILN